MPEKGKNNKTSADLANDFVHDLAKITVEPVFRAIGLDIKSSEDRSIAIRLLVRGKDENYYFQVVEGLHQLSEDLSGEDPETAETVMGVVGEIMIIGEENLGIDWS